MPSFALFPAALGGQQGIVALFLEAGPIAKLVFAILLFFSLMSWGIMFNKSRLFRRVARDNARFLEVFRKSSRFSEINNVAQQYASSPLVGLFQAGYIEIDAQVKSSQRGQAPSGTETRVVNYKISSMDGVERSLRRATAVELHGLAKSTSFLATTAAATPFIGLFGTVWGIMIAFSDIGAAGTASIVAVAPGIAEALVNTAAGLVAAIPALIGYNQAAAKLRAIRSEMEDFALEFLNLTERNFT